jgi:hypothetical protein
MSFWWRDLFGLKALWDGSSSCWWRGRRGRWVNKRGEWRKEEERIVEKRRVEKRSERREVKWEVSNFSFEITKEEEKKRNTSWCSLKKIKDTGGINEIWERLSEKREKVRKEKKWEKRKSEKREKVRKEKKWENC